MKSIFILFLILVSELCIASSDDSLYIEKYNVVLKSKENLYADESQFIDTTGGFETFVLNLDSGSRVIKTDDVDHIEFTKYFKSSNKIVKKEYLIYAKLNGRTKSILNVLIQTSNYILAYKATSSKKAESKIRYYVLDNNKTKLDGVASKEQVAEILPEYFSEFPKFIELSQKYDYSYCNENLLKVAAYLYVKPYYKEEDLNEWNSSICMLNLIKSESEIISKKTDNHKSNHSRIHPSIEMHCGAAYDKSSWTTITKLYPIQLGYDSNHIESDGQYYLFGIYYNQPFFRIHKHFVVGGITGFNVARLGGIAPSFGFPFLINLKYMSDIMKNSHTYGFGISLGTSYNYNGVSYFNRTIMPEFIYDMNGYSFKVLVNFPAKKQIKYSGVNRREVVTINTYPMLAVGFCIEL